MGTAPRSGQRWPIAVLVVALAAVVVTVGVRHGDRPSELRAIDPPVDTTATTAAPTTAPPATQTSAARTGGSISSTPPVPIATRPADPAAADGSSASAPATSGEPVSREIPGTTATAASSPPVAAAPAWAASVTTTDTGDVTTDLGCAAGTSADALSAFFAERAGPLLGMDYQHTYPLGGDRTLWLFQDAFVDQAGTARTLGQASFVHNAAVVQSGACFTLYHRGSAANPASFEPGTGEQAGATWFWPMGGEVSGDQLLVFWAQMRKDATDPRPGDGIGWHPESTWLATYDARTLERLDLRPAPNDGVAPIYGYAVASDDQYTYLFGNTFEQNLDREGGYANGPHSATRTYLARVQLGALDTAPAYWSSTGWSDDAASAQPVLQRGWVEDPLQPRWLGDRWVAVSKLDGYWGDTLTIDVAADPWGPWTTSETRALPGDSALTNTYHAQLLPWLGDGGQVVVSYSRNARNMTRDTWPHPERYRIAFTTAAAPAVPATRPSREATPLPPEPEPEPSSTDSTTTSTSTSTSTSTTVTPDDGSTTTVSTVPDA
ncbi:MAG: hypothetical protein QM733_23850 [Ilumatobacteraceae bacterium]